MRLKPFDLILLPLLALASAFATLALAEVTARVVMPEQLVESCATPGGAFKAGCVSRMKAAEGPWVTVSFNGCGSRSAHPCDSEPAGQARVVVFGSSISRGYAVPYDQMYSTRAEAALSALCGQTFDFQNLPITWPRTPQDEGWQSLKRAAKAGAELRPKVMLLFVAPWDLYEYNTDPTMATADCMDCAPWDLYEYHPSSAEAARQPAWKRTLFRALSAGMDRLRDLRDRHSRLVLAMDHYLTRDDTAYVQQQLRRGDESDYLRPTFDAAWQRRLAMLQAAAAPLAQAAAGAGARFAIVYAPFEPEMLLARGSVVAPGVDAHALERRLAALAKQHGWQFIDPLPDFIAAPPSKRYFYRVNGHPNGAGHALIAKAIVSALAGPAGGQVCEPRASQAIVTTPAAVRGPSGATLSPAALPAGPGASERAARAN